MNRLPLAAASLACAPFAFAEPPPAPPAPPAQAAPQLAPPESLITPDRLMDTLRSLPLMRASWADDRHKDGLRAAERLIVDRLKALGYTPELDPIDAIGSRAAQPPAPAAPADSPSREELALAAAPWHNIILNIPGNQTPREVLIFSAHIDAVADGPGADDDGSGVAALLEAARVLRDRPMQRTLRLIFFNLEEVGLVGSRIYAERLKPSITPDGETVLGMASLDGIGFYSDQPDSQRSPLPPLPGFTPPTVGDFLATAGIARHRTFSQALAAAMRSAAPELKLVVVDMLPFAPPDLLRSDHAPFLALGVSAVMLTDTANFRSPHYHKATDTVETIDQTRFTLAARAIVGAMYRLAGVPGEPPIELRRRAAEPDAVKPRAVPGK